MGRFALCRNVNVEVVVVVVCSGMLHTYICGMYVFIHIVMDDVRICPSLSLVRIFVFHGFFKLVFHKFPSKTWNKTKCIFCSFVLKRKVGSSALKDE